MGHPQGFRPPAHKHAHRLHSIPPRIKSTRALILDHMLWIHARTRFAQARAELAMSDPSGGPKSLNYPHRFRPELYDDDDNNASDGDDDRQDLALAHSLRLRAESPHRLPNSVRLRLALGTVINDLLARQPTPSRVPTDLPPFPLFSSLVSPSPRVTGFYNSGADPHTANAPPSLRCPRHLHAACHICLHPVALSRHSPGLGSGLLRSRTANPLRRAVHRTTLCTLIPRFLRLSALVAAELGQEQSLSSPPPPPPSHDLCFFNALRPTRHWYFLLAGLLTRAVLEGYLTAGWRGFQPAQCLLLVGIATNSPADSDQEPFADLDPDGFPNLDQAIRVLFPSLMDDPLLPSPSTSQSQEDTEYRSEMLQRLRRFCDIPESTPDLSTHMEDLAWSYPAEPLERAVVRFCEAVARWRGKPELETYNNKKPPASSGMSIDSLLHQSPPTPRFSTLTPTPYHFASFGSVLGPPPPPPPPPVPTLPPPRPTSKPSIDMYFSGMSPQVRSKRRRDEQDVEEEEREERMKRLHLGAI